MARWKRCAIISIPHPCQDPVDRSRKPTAAHTSLQGRVAGYQSCDSPRSRGERKGMARWALRPVFPFGSLLGEKSGFFQGDISPLDAKWGLCLTRDFWFDLHRGENVRRTAAAMLVLVVGISLSGCMTKTVSLTSSETAIPRCSPNPSIDVTELGSKDRAQCDAAEAVVIFPDGMQTIAPDILGVNSRSTGSPHSTSDTYTTYNLGIYGVVAVQVPRLGGQPYFWGSPHGLKLIKKLY